MAEVYADTRDFQSQPISGLDEVHAAFFEESRTRGRSRMTRGRKPGFASVGMTSLRAAPWFELVDGAGTSRSLHFASVLMNKWRGKDLGAQPPLLCPDDNCRVSSRTCKHLERRMRCDCRTCGLAEWVSDGANRRCRWKSCYLGIAMRRICPFPGPRSPAFDI